MQVRRGGNLVALEPQSFRLLQFLIENRERVVSKEAIFETVWEGRAVSDNALTRAIAQLRKGLGDDPRTPLYIDTIPTVGYRFIGALQEENAAVAVPPSPKPAQQNRKSPWIVAAGAVLLIAILIVAAVVLVPLLWPGPKVQTAATSSDLKPVALTSYPGIADWPSFSPDGSEVAFQWNNGQSSGNLEDDRNFNIFVKRVGADTTPQRITSGSAPDVWPAWSPDGKTIAFERILSATKADLMVVPAHGGAERKLVSLNLWIDRMGNTPTWSNNSKWLVVPAYSDLGVALYRVSVETGEINPIVPPQNGVGYRFPTLSPDGKSLLYVEHPAYNGGTLWTVHVDADLNAIDTPRILDLGNRLIFQGIYTADGKQIIARQLGGLTFRVNADGSGAVQNIKPFSGGQRDLGLSLRGDRLAYVALKGNANIWRIDLTQKTLHPEPLIASPMREVYPQYSPDGKKLAYHSHFKDEVMNISVADANGENPRRLTAFSTGVTGTAHWSPDNTTLSFDSNANGVYQVFSISADGSNQRQLTHSASENFGSSWSHDGKWIYYSSRATGRHEIWKTPPQGGAAVQVTHSGGWMGTESVDHTHLFYCKDSPADTLWMQDLASGHEEQIADAIFRCNYAVAKQGIYYMPAPKAGGPTKIMFYSFTTKRSSVVLPIGVPDYGMDVSPDGRYLAYGQFDDGGSDLMMIEGFK